MTASVSFYLIAILALCVKSHPLQERNVLIVDHNVFLKTVELPGPTRCQSNGSRMIHMQSDFDVRMIKQTKKSTQYVRSNDLHQFFCFVLRLMNPAECNAEPLLTYKTTKKTITKKT